jgi:excisionase family DNA binding protein
MTLDEVAAFLQVHPSTIYRLLKRHEIPAFKMGSEWRFNRESIERWIQALEAKVGHWRRQDDLMHGKRKGMGWRNFEPRNFPLTVNISSAINSPLLFQSLRTWNHFKAQSRSRSKAAAWRMELRMNRKSRGAIIWAVAERVTDKLPAPALIKPFGQPRRRPVFPELIEEFPSFF